VSTHPAIATLIPHQGGMCLHERVLAFDEARVTLATATHRSPDNPLRRNGRLHAIHLCEYGAQAMAVHAGLLANSRGERAGPGLLVSLREVVLSVARIDDLDGELVTDADCVLAGADSAQYAFRIRHGDALLAQGRAAVMLRLPA